MIDEAIILYGIDISGVNGVPQYDPRLSDDGATNPYNGKVSIGSSAFSSEGYLANTIYHESIHIEQLSEGRWYISENGSILNELEAYDAEMDLYVAGNPFNLSSDEASDIWSSYNAYYSLLLSRYQNLVDNGIFVVNEPTIERNFCHHNPILKR